MKRNTGISVFLYVVLTCVIRRHTVLGESVERTYEYSIEWTSPDYNEPTSTISLDVVSLWKEQKEEVSLYKIQGRQDRFLAHTSDSVLASIYFEKDVKNENYLKGLASLFLNRRDSWSGWQRDVSGDCFVTYTPLKDNKVMKEKKECMSKETVRHKIHDDRRLHSWGSNATLMFKTDGSLEGVTVEEKLVKREASGDDYIIESKQNMKLTQESIGEDLIPKGKKMSNVKDVISALNDALSTEFFPKDITTDSPNSRSKFKSIDILPLKTFLKDNKLSTPEGAKAFLDSIKMLKNADEKDIAGLLKDKANKQILPQLIDVLGSIHSTNAFKAVLSTYKPSSAVNIKLLERFIWALSSVEHFWTPQNHHNEFIASELFQHLKTSKFATDSLKDSFIISLSLICNNIKSNDEYLNWFLESLKSCKDDACSLKYLKALQNVEYSRLDDYRQKVLNMVKMILKSDKSSKRLKINALRLLKAVAPELNEGLHYILFTVFINPQEDNSVRIAVFELLIENNFEAQTVIYIIQNLSGNVELSSYVIHKLNSHPKMRYIYSDLILSGYWNWDSLSTSGQSLSYLDNGEYYSSDFGLEISSSKILKHGHLHINLPNVSNFLKMELSAGGLSGFIADKADPNDDPSAHLSVELSLLGIPLRPFVLFNSMSELTSLYWSGSLEKKQSLLGFNRLVYDSESIHVFSSGLRIESALKGAFSMDISGSIVVSLFSQTADSQLSTAFGGYVKRSLLGIWNDQNIFSNVHEGHGKFTLDLDGDIRFDGRSCVQLRMQPVKMREETKITSMDSSNKKSTTRKDGHNLNLPGQTLSLHHKISQLCNEVA